jgi:hypothetical protein
MGKGFIVDGIKSRKRNWQELSAITKRLKSKDTILVDKGTFVEAMEAWGEGDSWFAGLPPGAVGKDGRPLEEIGAIHEDGLTVEVTDRMKDFLSSRGFPLKKTTKFIMVPPRKWFEPAMEELEVAADGILEPMVTKVVASI